MTFQLPTWTAFQPDAAPSLPSERGHVVALVALPGLGEADGGAGLAVDLARAWAEAGKKVVLADLGLTEPRLHGVLGVDNADGVSDAVAFGSSVGRVARSVDGAPFFFIGAGTAVADPAALLEHDRWGALCQGFQEAGATLAVFVPSDAVTRRGVLAHATEIVFLGGPDDDAKLDAEVGGAVVALLGRDPADRPPPVPVETEAPDPVPAAASASPQSEPEVFEDPEPEPFEEPEPEPEALEESEPEPQPEPESDFEPWDFDLDTDDLPQASAGDFPLVPGSLPGDHGPEEPDDADGEGGEAEDVETAAGEGDFAVVEDEPSDELRTGDELALQPEAADIVGDLGLSSDEEAPDALAGDEASEDDFALPPEEPASGTAAEEGSDDFALVPEEPEDTGAGPDDFVLEPEESEDTGTGLADFGLEPEEPDAGLEGVELVADEPADDFALEPEPVVEDEAPAEPLPTSEAQDHPPVPLADEILAEAGDAPEAMPFSADDIPEYAPGEKGGSSTRRTLLLFLLLLVATAASWWLGYLEIPGVPGPESLFSSAPAAERVRPLVAAEPAAESPPTATAAPAPWVIALEAHRDRTVAWARSEELGRQASDDLWLTAPLEVDGTVFHRVLVGTAADPEAVQALRSRVAGALGVSGEGWMRRYTPLAWSLGEDETLAAARGRAASLREQEIPAYVLAVSYSDGSERYRTYAGAYADEAEAAWLGAFLQERGVTGQALTERAGHLPE